MRPVETRPHRTTLFRMPDAQAEPDAAETSEPAEEMAPQTQEGLLAQTSIGQPLDHATGQFFGPRFGHSFSNDRIHSDGEADRLARSVDTSAFTYRQDIFFRTGRY